MGDDIFLFLACLCLLLLSSEIKMEKNNKCTARACCRKGVKLKLFHFFLIN
jgi:hypothetical protein